jgi:hypothetical protein
LRWTKVCTRLDLVDRAAELYELLKPYPGQFATTGTGVSGSIDWALGVLATTLGRHEQADGHFAAAAEMEERLGAPLFLARTHASWARALLARGQPEDRERAQHLLEHAEQTAGALGADGVAREVAECRAALAAVTR